MEEKLRLVISKLEQKIKTIYDENVNLKQTIELVTLDKELSEENSIQLEDQISLLKTELQQSINKQNQLIELNELNSEIIQSFDLEKTKLLTEINDLKTRQDENNFNIQELESLKLELQINERKLKKTEFQLELLKNGLENTLKNLFGDEPFIQVISTLNPNLDDYFAKYLNGDISLNSLKSDLQLFIQNYKTKLTTDNELINQNNELNVQKEEKTESSSRLEILETKLEKAKKLNSELSEIKMENQMLETKLKGMEENLAESENLINKLNNELNMLKRKTLPTEILKISKIGEINDLKNAIKFYTKERKTFKLTELNVPKFRLSATCGNKRVERLRRCDFGDGWADLFLL